MNIIKKAVAITIILSPFLFYLAAFLYSLGWAALLFMLAIFVYIGLFVLAVYWLAYEDV